jgi:hypothetical protein
MDVQRRPKNGRRHGLSARFCRSGKIWRRRLLFPSLAAIGHDVCRRLFVITNSPVAAVNVNGHTTDSANAAHRKRNAASVKAAVSEISQRLGVRNPEKILSMKNSGMRSAAALNRRPKTRISG